jgi:hypothetical protein
MASAGSGSGVVEAALTLAGPMHIGETACFVRVGVQWNIRKTVGDSQTARTEEAQGPKENGSP